MTDKENFIKIYTENIHREGSDKLLDWLEKTDFFSAPASTKYHLAEEGGLIKHSLNVYRMFRDEVIRFSKDKSGIDTLDAEMEEKVAIIALLHDLCKAQFYNVSTKNVKNEQTGQWEKVPYYSIDDKFPFGHGEKSVFLIERFMRLKLDEAMAIRWHMGGFDDSVKGGSYALGNAFQAQPLCLLIHIADMKATYLFE